jgi:hypothetical protein
VLFSRTSGSDLVYATVSDFFEKYPTPSAVIDADPAQLAAELHPLGLNRERTLPRTAAGFLSRAWALGGEASDLFGVGASLGNASWRLFCLGDLSVATDKGADPNVRAFAQFCVKQLAKGKGAKGGKGAAQRGGHAKAAAKAPSSSSSSSSSSSAAAAALARTRAGSKRKRGEAASPATPASLPAQEATPPARTRRR